MINKILTIPEFSLVMLVGVSGAGKTTFARKNFLPTQVLTSDKFRAMVSDDENCMEASHDAFEVLYSIAQKRLSRRLITVIDATNIQDYGRRRLLDFAREYGASPVAIILNIPEDICIERTLRRTDRPIPMDILQQHLQEFRETLEIIPTEGFHFIYILDGQEEAETALVSISSPEFAPVEEVGARLCQ
jgi:protein phosphatase